MHRRHYSWKQCIQPEGAAGAGVDWSVDKEEVATIDANGLLTAVKAGTVVVTATDKENEKLNGRQRQSQSQKKRQL